MVQSKLYVVVLTYQRRANREAYTMDSHLVSAATSATPRGAGPSAAGGAPPASSKKISKSLWCPVRHHTTHLHCTVYTPPSSSYTLRKICLFYYLGSVFFVLGLYWALGKSHIKISVGLLTHHRVYHSSDRQRRGRLQNRISFQFLIAPISRSLYLLADRGWMLAVSERLVSIACKITSKPCLTNQNKLGRCRKSSFLCPSLGMSSRIAKYLMLILVVNLALDSGVIMHMMLTRYRADT